MIQGIKGFTQEYGIDYKETFASIARLTSLKCLIVVAAIRCSPLASLSDGCEECFP